MSKQLGLFDRKYPLSPGYQAVDTSYRAARKIRKAADKIMDACFELLKREALTPDEVAAKLNRFPGSVRPRCTELKKRGLVEPTGEERPSSFGSPMEVLRAKETENI